MDSIEETTEPSFAELKEYIEQLKRYIQVLEEDNQDLRTEVQEYRRREIHLVMQRS